MGILNARPRLDDGEHLRWQSLANRVIGANVTAGGRLVVTDRRVFFQPNRIDKSLGRELWQCPPEAVTGIGTVGRDGRIFAGGTRRRLGIHTAGGEEVFVVNRLRKKEAQLRELLLGSR